MGPRSWGGLARLCGWLLVPTLIPFSLTATVRGRPGTESATDLQVHFRGNAVVGSFQSCHAGSSFFLGGGSIRFSVLLCKVFDIGLIRFSLEWRVKLLVTLQNTVCIDTFFCTAICFSLERRIQLVLTIQEHCQYLNFLSFLSLRRSARYGAIGATYCSVQANALHHCANCFE